MNRPFRANVIVPVYRDTAMTVRCLRSVLEHDDALGRLIVLDDASPEPDMAAALAAVAASDDRVVLLHNPRNLGFVATCNRGLAERRGDAVLLNSDTLVTAGWLAELAEVAHTDDRTACASPLSNNATICSVPEFCEETPADRLAEPTVRTATAHLPRSGVVPTCVGFCLYLRGEVLDVVGLLDPAFGRGYNEENDWVMRAQAMGFVARRAHRALVYHFGHVSFQRQANRLEKENGRVLKQNHPHYEPQVGKFCMTLDAYLPAHSVRVESTGRLRVALDLRHLPNETVGTRTYAARLAHGLARSREVELAIVARHPAQVAGLPGRVVFEERFLPDVEVIHKPAQVFDARELELLFASPAHTVISFLDLIAVRAPCVFPDQEQADRYRATSYLALQAAQATIAISEHAKGEIHAEFGIPEEEIFVTPLAVDREQFGRRDANDAALRSRLGLPARYFLSVATDFPHKNLANLLAAYIELRARWTDGEPPALALVGHRTSVRQGVYDGDAAGQGAGILRLGTVSDDELRALYQGTEALVFPSVYEGFGLPILEAMAAGVPVIALPFSSVAEVGGDGILVPDGVAARDLARAMERIATDPELRRRMIDRGTARVAEFSWDETIRRTLEAYRTAVFRPSERSLRARRHLQEVLFCWSAESTKFVRQPPGIRAAWKNLDLAVRQRARRELQRLRLFRPHFSLGKPTEARMRQD